MLAVFTAPKQLQSSLISEWTNFRIRLTISCVIRPIKVLRFHPQLDLDSWTQTGSLYLRKFVIHLGWYSSTPPVLDQTILNFGWCFLIAHIHFRTWLTEKRKWLCAENIGLVVRWIHNSGQLVRLWYPLRMYPFALIVDVLFSLYYILLLIRCVQHNVTTVYHRNWTYLFLNQTKISSTWMGL